MSSINTNVAAMAAVRSLSSTSMDLAKTQQRVETGLRTSRANDDPAVFAISQRMRADLKGMAAVKDSLAFGRSTLTVARDAATKISDELASLKQTVTQGQQQGLDQTQIQTQIDNALTNIDAYVNSADFNGVNLLDNSGDLNIIRNIAGDTQDVTGVDRTAAGLGLTGLDVNQADYSIAFDNTLAPAATENITITSGGVDYVFEFVDDAGGALTAQPDATTEVFAVTGDLANISPLEAMGLMMTKIREQGFGAEMNDNGELILSGSITAVTTDVTGGGAPAQVNGTDNAITAVNTALDTMGDTLATLGAALQQVEGLQDFTVKLNDSIKEGLGALVDADLAEESARLTSLQTKQQLATQSLSIANQQSQSLLSLFR
jgi:flagellin